MKKVIRASSDEYIALEHAKRVLKKMKELFDVLDATPSGFIGANSGLGLSDLYNELKEDIPDLDYAIRFGDIAVDVGIDVSKKKKYEDMW